LDHQIIRVRVSEDHSPQNTLSDRFPQCPPGLVAKSKNKTVQPSEAVPRTDEKEKNRSRALGKGLGLLGTTRKEFDSVTHDLGNQEG